MLFTNTDSLTYQLKSEDVYEEFFKHKHLFGFSNYPKDSKFFDETNKVIGKMKDVQEGKIINEFVGLKSKMYSMKDIDGKETNTAKVVNIAKEFNEFKDTLFNKKILRNKMRRIQSKKHKLKTYEINKNSLSCLMIKELLQIMAFIRGFIFIKSYENRFTQIKKIEKILTDKRDLKDSQKRKRFKKILVKRKDSHR